MDWTFWISNMKTIAITRRLPPPSLRWSWQPCLCWLRQFLYPSSYRSHSSSTTLFTSLVICWHTIVYRMETGWKLIENIGKFWKNINRVWWKVVENGRSFHASKGNFRKILGRFGFLIIVTWKEFRTSINRRATPPKVNRFQLLNSHTSNPWTRFQLRISLPSNSTLSPRTCSLRNSNPEPW